MSGFFALLSSTILFWAGLLTLAAHRKPLMQKLGVISLVGMVCILALCMVAGLVATIFIGPVALAKSLDLMALAVIPYFCLMALAGVIAAPSMNAPGWARAGFTAVLILTLVFGVGVTGAESIYWAWRHAGDNLVHENDHWASVNIATGKDGVSTSDIWPFAAVPADTVRAGKALLVSQYLLESAERIKKVAWYWDDTLITEGDADGAGWHGTRTQCRQLMFTGVPKDLAPGLHTFRVVATTESGRRIEARAWLRVR